MHVHHTAFGVPEAVGCGTDARFPDENAELPEWGLAEMKPSPQALDHAGLLARLHVLERERG